jgi:hypothetical protein
MVVMIDYTVIKDGVPVYVTSDLSDAIEMKEVLQADEIKENPDTSDNRPKHY